jgi:predicted lipoprotein
MRTIAPALSALTVLLVLATLLAVAGCDKPKTPKVAGAAPQSGSPAAITAAVTAPFAQSLTDAGAPHTGASPAAPAIAPATPPGTPPVTGLSTPPDAGGAGKAAFR